MISLQGICCGYATGRNPSGENENQEVYGQNLKDVSAPVNSLWPSYDRYQTSWSTLVQDIL